MNITSQSSPPKWLHARAAKHLIWLASAALAHANCDGPVRLVFSHEHQVRKRKHMLADSLLESVGHSKSGPGCVVLCVAGEVPRDDLAFVLVCMPADQCTHFREYLARQPNGIWQPPSQPEKPNPEPAAPVVPTMDADTITLFLDAVKDAGGTITRSTLQVILQRDFPGLEAGLLTAVTQERLFECVNDVCSLTPKGRDRLKVQEAPVLDSTQFQQLRQRVLRAREKLATLEPQHEQQQQTRLKLEKRLREAHPHLQEAERIVLRLELELDAAKQTRQTLRGNILNWEKELRSLGDSNQYIHAQRELQEAEEEYRQLTAI